MLTPCRPCAGGRFLGTTNFGSGTWVGIELDTAWGKNDGCVKVRRPCGVRPGVGGWAAKSNGCCACGRSCPSKPLTASH